MMTAEDIVASAKADLEYLCNDSADLSYLKNFTYTYNKYRDKINKLSLNPTERRQALFELEQMTDKMIVYKLSYMKHCEGILDHVDCMSEMKSCIDNKYVRYVIYACCYQDRGKYFFNQIDGRNKFIQHMEFIYNSLKRLFRDFPSTESHTVTKQKSNNNLVTMIKNASK